MKHPVSPAPRRDRSARIFAAAGVAVALAVLMTAGTTTATAAGQQKPRGPSCSLSGSLVRVPDLREGSGIAPNHRNPGRAWAHNDSGLPELIALDAGGRATGRVRIAGAAVDDWEAIASGPCASGTCLYIGDIGDNDATRRRITIYRLPEPDPAAGSARVSDTLHATYPDGPHDAETLLVTPKGDIYVVTKGDTGPVALYRFPRDVKAGATATLERVGSPRDSGQARAEDRITDGAVSPGGERVVLRSTRVLRVYLASDLLAGTWREAGRLDLRPYGEPQGEGIAFADARTLYLLGEGGGGRKAGTFARLGCAF